jgi:hypothetical protein
VGEQGPVGPDWTLTTPSFNADGTVVVNGTSGSGGPVTSSEGAWLTTGNTAVSSNYIGTNNAIDFRTYSNGIERMTIESNGNIGFFTPTPTYKFHVYNNADIGASTLGSFSNDGISGVAVSGVNSSAANGWNGLEGGTSGTGAAVMGLHLPTTGYGIGVYGVTNSPLAAWAGLFTGDVGSSTGFFMASDYRWKKNIASIESVIDKVMNLEVKSYRMRASEFPGMNFNPNKIQFGFIAQDLKEIFPEIVQQKAIPDPTATNSLSDQKEMVEGYYTVNYISLIPILTRAIQEQQVQITELQEQLDFKADIDASSLTAYRIIASSNARLDAENLFIADSNSKAYVIGILNEENNGVSVIQTSGIVQVEVDASNGSIMAGDFVTTSNLGKAIKSLSSEWVIGVAVSNEINGLVEVRIDIRFKQ